MNQVSSRKVFKRLSIVNNILLLYNLHNVCYKEYGNVKVKVCSEGCMRFSIFFQQTESSGIYIIGKFAVYFLAWLFMKPF